MINEEQKAINKAKFFAKKCAEIDEEIHQLSMKETKLKIELLSTQKQKDDKTKEMQSYNRKLRQMVIEI